MSQRSLRAAWIAPVFAAALLQSSVAPAAQECGVPEPGLVAWYPGDGSTVDLALGNDATLENGATFAEGAIGDAFALDGDDDRVSAPTLAATDPTTAGSMAAWIFLDELPSAAAHIMEIIGRGGSGADFDLQVELDDKVRFYVAAGTKVASSGRLPTGTWVHVAATFDQAVGLKIYLDGALENITAGAFTRAASGQPLLIGDQPVFSPRRFAGRIDEVVIYDRSLSKIEVESLACAEHPVCGDANADVSVTAGDALVILKAAVGQPLSCPVSRCDTDSEGGVVAGDALRTLRFAVGQPVELLCP